MDDHRLTRIEDKLDRLADAMISLVRVEERTGTLVNRLDAVDERLAEHSRRISAVERTSEGRGVVFGMVDRVFWSAATATITGAIGFVIYYIKGK